MLHEEVRDARVQRGLTQVRLAELAGVPRSQLRKFESGGNITLGTLRKIVAQLPNLERASFEGIELHFTPSDAGRLRFELAELIAIATRLLRLLDGEALPVTAPSSATRFEGGTQISPDLELRLRSLEHQLTRGIRPPHTKADR